MLWGARHIYMMRALTVQKSTVTNAYLYIDFLLGNVILFVA